jgi:hypothetical protein
MPGDPRIGGSMMIVEPVFESAEHPTTSERQVIFGKVAVVAEVACRG